MPAQQDVIEADFIVIGAGSAGCAIAARLSEDPAIRVVLLEAGGEDRNRWIHIPLGFGKTFADPSVNWCYETEPDPGAAGRRVFWPRGKVLGGSSSINGMVYIRGQAEDFDHWRQLGNTGWSFDDVLPYFKRSELGIPIVHHLPGVGQSLQDHYSAPIKLKCRLPITVNDVMQSNLRKVRAGLQYYMFKNGPLAMGTSPAALFARTRPELASADIKCSCSPFSADRPQDGLHPWSGFTMIVYQLRPESRGRIELKSADPAQPPAVHPNYLATPTDQQTIVDGLRLLRRILATPQMQSFIVSEFLPGPEIESDEQLLDFARRRGGTVFHPTSTCRMGIDATAVVDPELRVHGLGGLRVADASIMPTVVSGNTNAATIMIGEKAADLVRQKIRLAA